VSQVFASVSMSLDGFIAGPNRGPTNPLGDAGSAIHSWILRQKAFRQLQGLGGGGETGLDNQIVEETLERIGSNIMGKRMFEEGEANWPEEPPFHSSVFVLTHERRPPWRRRGGTTFYFVNEGIDAALEQARDAAGGKDVRISGGADVIRQYINAGLVDELQIQLAPTFLRDGLRLFEGIDSSHFSLEILEAIHSPRVTHLRYRLKKA
jgi:dihydrofolate reductase